MDTCRYLLKRDVIQKNTDRKEPEFCGILHKSGECSYINCSYTVDHYHCSMCGSGAVEVYEAVTHIRSSPLCHRESQNQHTPLNESGSFYNAFYGGALTAGAPNTLCPNSYSSYAPLDSFQWHPAVPVDKMILCGPQLSPCFSTSNNSRIQMDSSLSSPISHLYNKISGPMKDLVSLQSKNCGVSSDSQSWFYNTQPVQVYKYAEQSSVPQINFLLLDPSVEHRGSPVSSDLLPYSNPNKSDGNSNIKDLKESLFQYCQSNIQSVPGDDTSLFTLQIDEGFVSKHTELFTNEQMSARNVCAKIQNKENKNDRVSEEALSVGQCCLLIDSTNNQRENLNFSHYKPCTTNGNNMSAHQTDENMSSGSESDESDIVVEDTGDELSAIAESEMSIETIKCSLLQEVENVTQNVGDGNGNFTPLRMDRTKTTNISELAETKENVKCVICGHNSTRYVLIDLGSQLPVTSTSHSPVLNKLSKLVAVDTSDILDNLGGLLCQRCMDLVDIVDSLESQLESARQNILQMFKVVDKSFKGIPIMGRDDLHVENEHINQEEADECSEVLTVIEGKSDKHSPSKQAVMDTVDLLRVVSKKELETVQLTLTPEEQRYSNNISSNLEVSPECQTGDENYPLLQKTSSESSELDKHAENLHYYQFYCVLCETGLLNQQQLNSHMNLHKHSDSTFLCEICGRRFQYKHQKQIDRHLLLHCPLDRFLCTQCNKRFKSSRALKDHSKVHSGERPFPCPICARRFAHISNMRAHSKLCSGDLPFRCDKCNAGFAVETRLQRHVALAHTGAAVIRCTHNQCEKTFVKMSDLRIHQRVHSTIRAFSCKVCNRSYKSLSNLNHHAKIHQQEKPFSCNLCGQGFIRRDSWESHINCHKGATPFQCILCPKAFAKKNNLTLHEKRHAGTHKKNRCPICDKVFSQKLSVHMRTHTKDRPYQCSKCSQLFSTGSSLNKHILDKHSAQIGQPG